MCTRRQNDHPWFWRTQKTSLFLPGYSQRRGLATVIILLTVVLLSSLIVAYFSQTQVRRNISFSSAGQARANLLVNTAIETIKGDLLDEIRAGSTVQTTGSISIFNPTSNFTSVPQRTGSNGSAAVLKVSTALLPMWSGTGYSYNGPVRSGSGNSTASIAVNGRTISQNRWLQPQLLTSSETLPSPDWVIITRGGAVAIDASTPIPSITQMKDKSTSNLNFAIGRYAYVIYDQGGLLDVTAAGYPSSGAGLSGTETGRKGSLAFADLTRIPNGPATITQSQIDSLVAWRNKSSESGYFSYVTGFARTNGFMRVQVGDQTFVSRQDLITYAQANGLSSALPYLTTFTRRRNAPSWGPSTPAGSSIDYAAQANATTSANRFVPQVRFPLAATITTYHDTGASYTYDVDDGSPLLRRRFSLGRLTWIGVNGPQNGGTAKNIQACFGLIWNSSSSAWQYVGPTGSTVQASIETLDQVANESSKREPNFFELLKAGILNGSLGKGVSGAANEPQGMTSLDNQLIQIGVNIIDQYDSTNYPTTILFNARDFYGIKNLPYFTRALTYVYQDPSDPNQSANPNGGVIAAWTQPELWRPYQDPGITSGTLPRVCVQASGRTYINLGQSGFTAQDGPAVDFSASPALGQIEFNPSTIPYDHPVGLSTTNGAISSNPLNLRAGWPNSPAAIYNGYAPMLAGFTSPWATVIPNQIISGVTQWSLALQWWNPYDSSWHTYSRLEYIVGTPSLWITNVVGWNNKALYFFGRPDPRTDRFGTSGNGVATESYNPGLSIRPTADHGYSVATYLPTGTGFNFPSGKHYLGLFSDNQNTSASYYNDMDGLTRRAAGAYVNGAGTDGYPLIPSATSSDNQNGRRPVMLNRPFQSVAELGYAFRDLPFKELDFFTKESADAGLLDLFSAGDDPEIEAGCISLNTRRPEVLEAVLSGAIRREYAASATLSTDVPAIAQTIVAHTTNAAKGPLKNRSGLVTELSDEFTSAFSSTADQMDKTQRESVVRALADVSDTRTWNLLIDVIAQAGRYAPSVQDINSFVVEGERHYWVHIAIDRYTGEIIDQQYEPVVE